MKFLYHVLQGVKLQLRCLKRIALLTFVQQFTGADLLGDCPANVPGPFSNIREKKD